MANEPVYIPRGDPPVSMQRRLAAEASVLAGEESSSVSVLPASVTVSRAESAPAVPRGENISLAYSPRNGSKLTLQFRVTNVNIKPNHLAFMMVSEVGLDFSELTRDISITYRGVTYPVIWVGGIFEFADLGVNCICFMRDKKSDTSHDDQRQPSSSG